MAVPKNHLYSGCSGVDREVEEDATSKSGADEVIDPVEGGQDAAEATGEVASAAQSGVSGSTDSEEEEDAGTFYSTFLASKASENPATTGATPRWPLKHAEQASTSKSTPKGENTLKATSRNREVRWDDELPPNLSPMAPILHPRLLCRLKRSFTIQDGKIVHEQLDEAKVETPQRMAEGAGAAPT